VYGETDPHWQWTQGLAHIVDCLRHGKRPELRPEHALHVLEVMLAAHKAGNTGRAQPIRSRFRLPPPRAAAQSAQAHRVHNQSQADD
jgi:hypothetical protein